MTNAPDPADPVEAAVLAAVGGGDRPARFVTEIVRSVAKAGSPPPPDAVERALTKLEDRGVLLVRDHYCADPHLEGVDLRIAASLPKAGSDDPQSTCIRAIEATWQEWITSYLAEHRCS
jgi:hypothetical protein